MRQLTHEVKVLSHGPFNRFTLLWVCYNIGQLYSNTSRFKSPWVHDPNCQNVMVMLTCSRVYVIIKLVFNMRWQLHMHLKIQANTIENQIRTNTLASSAKILKVHIGSKCSHTNLTFSLKPWATTGRAKLGGQKTKLKTMALNWEAKKHISSTMISSFHW